MENRQLQIGGIDIQDLLERGPINAYLGWIKCE